MRTLWLAAFMIAALATQGHAQFFPKSSLDLRGDDFKAKWYSTQLRALREPSLLAVATNTKAESYRFLWLRTFHHPIAVRVDLQADGTWILITKVASGAGGYGPGTLTTNTSRPLTAQEAQSLRSKVENDGFWVHPTRSTIKQERMDRSGLLREQKPVVTMWSTAGCLRMGLPATWASFLLLTWQG